MIHRPEAEKLLGGFAAGILTEAERTLLFKEALNHQEVFDALMDEEALRELLADPEARNELLNALAPESMPQPAPVRPLWRSPAWLGAAASLFLLITTTLVIKRTPQVQVPSAPSEFQPKIQAEPRSESAPQPISPAKQVEPLAQKAAPKPELKDQEMRRREDAPPPMETPAKAPGGVPSTDAVHAPAPLPAPSPAVQGLGAAANLAPGVASGRLLKEEAAKSKLIMEDRASAKANAGASREGDKKAARALSEVAAESSPIPAWAMERLEGGRLRLRVTWTSGHLYLLGRSPQGTRVISPSRQSRDANRTTSLYEFLPRVSETLELALHAEPVAHPAESPAQWQHRVWP